MSPRRIAMGIGALGLLGALAIALGSRSTQPDPGVAEGVAALEALYEPRSGLTSEAETEALLARREAAREAVADRIAQGGASGVLAALKAWETSSSRERLVLLEGLRHNDTPEAVDALEGLYGDAERFRLREEVLRALGANPAAGAHPLLVDQAAHAEDERLSQIAAAALYGEPAALGALSELVRGEVPMNTRLEAVHSLAGIGTPDAEAALTALAEDPAAEQRVRVYAKRELERGF